MEITFIRAKCCFRLNGKTSEKDHYNAKKILLQYDNEFANNVQYILHFAGSVMIKEFNLHHTKNADGAEDADDEDGRIQVWR